MKQVTDEKCARFEGTRQADMYCYYHRGTSYG